VSKTNCQPKTSREDPDPVNEKAADYRCEVIKQAVDLTRLIILYQKQLQKLEHILKGSNLSNEHAK
jgi:hypothetical protein